MEEAIKMPTTKSFLRGKDTPEVVEFPFGIEQLPAMFSHPKELANRIVNIGTDYFRVLGVMAAGHIEDDDFKIDEFSLFTRYKGIDFPWSVQ